MWRMLILLLVVAALPAANPALAQGPPIPRDNQPPKVGTARIRGHVLAADSGQPLRKAQVRAVATEIRENRATSTDGEGRFELKDLPAGRYNITASKGSFVSLQYGQLRPFTAGQSMNERSRRRPTPAL